MKAVFVFGAGASKAVANTPLGSELIWKYPLQCNRFTPKGAPGARQRFPKFGRFLEIPAGIFPELTAERDRRNKLGANQMYYPWTVQDKRHYADNLLKILQERHDREGTELIRKLIFEHVIARAHLLPRPKLYEALKEQICKKLIGGSISIISFNFNSLLREDLSVRTDQRRISFNYLLDFDYGEGSPERDGIPLIKLNGSLDRGYLPKLRASSSLRLRQTTFLRYRAVQECCMPLAFGTSHSYPSRGIWSNNEFPVAEGESGVEGRTETNDYWIFISGI